MPSKKEVLINPILSQYIYYILINTTVEDRRKLNGKYLTAAKHSRTAKNFSVKSTMEEKAILLSKLGIDFAWALNIGKDAIEQMKEDGLFKGHTVVSRMIENKILIVTDKEIMQYLHLMASTCHSEMWLMNTDFLKIGYRLKQYRKEYNNTTLNEMTAGRNNCRDWAKNQWSTIMMNDLAPDIVGVTKNSFDVLMYMFSRPQEILLEREIKKAFTGLYRNFKVGYAITELKKSSFIEKSYLSDETAFRVTGLGVDAVMRFQKRVLNAENF